MKKKQKTIRVIKGAQSSEDKSQILRLGMQTDFWRIITEKLEENIEHLNELEDSDDMADLPPDQYKLEVALLKAKRKYIRKLIDLPQVLIEFLANPEADSFNLDPYETADDQK